MIRTVVSDENGRRELVNYDRLNAWIEDIDRVFCEHKKNENPFSIPGSKLRDEVDEIIGNASEEEKGMMLRALSYAFIEAKREALFYVRAEKDYENIFR